MIPVNEPLLGGNEKKYILECIDTNWISSEGPFVRRFEEELASRVDREYGIAVTNGTAALDLAVAALNIGHGDEVIMPAFTIISCAASIVNAGAIPVLVDNDLNTWNMDVSKIEERITNRTKAIMVVHIYGLPVDMDPVLELAEKYNLAIIEDAAEAHGQEYKGKPCGSFGDISTFSFYPNKHITTGEGGMVVTNNEALAERCRSLRNLCFQREKRFVHEELGWNLRMTNMQAALGVAQLEQLDLFIEKKKAMGDLYTRLFDGTPGITLPPKRLEYAENHYWVYGLLLDPEVGYDAIHVMGKLREHKIGTRPFFFPMHKQPVFIKKEFFVGESYPVAEYMAEKGFYIPSGLGLTEQQMETVATSVKEELYHLTELAFA